MQKLSRRTTVIASSLVLTIVASVAAFAFWTNSSSGSGQASTADSIGSVDVAQTSDITGLYPGGPFVALNGTLTNSSDATVFVHHVSAAVGAIGPDPQANLALDPCTAADFELAGSPTTVNTSIGAGSSASWSGLSIRMRDRDANQNNCKNVDVTINYSTD